MSAWRGVPGWPEYEVSRDGAVRSNRKLGAAVVGQPIKPWTHQFGYQLVGFYRNGRKVKNMRVHVLVAAAFLGPRPLGADVNHKNGDKADNGADNLEYVTRTENMIHATSIGRSHPRFGAKLTAAKVQEIRARHHAGETNAALAVAFGVSPSAISMVINRRTWSHV